MTARTRRIIAVLVRRPPAPPPAAGRCRPRPAKKTTFSAEIETQRVSVADLEKLDELKATRDEITLLRSWLDEAWSLRSKHEYDQVREVLDRAPQAGGV